VCYSEDMSELIKFPTIQKPTMPETPGIVGENINPAESKVLEFKRDLGIGGKVKACLFQDSPSVTIGGEVVIELCGKNYKGTVIAILKRDPNNNVTKIAYSVPFLNGDDPLKFGEADFTYNTKIYD